MEKLKTYWLKIKSYAVALLLIAVSAFVSYLLFSYWEAFSAFGIAFLVATIAVAMLFIIDKLLLHGWDTFEEIKKGNIAVGLILMAYAILIGSCIIAAFIVWK